MSQPRNFSIQRYLPRRVWSFRRMRAEGAEIEAPDDVEPDEWCVAFLG
jgi:hypothetical protein